MITVYLKNQIYDENSEKPDWRQEEETTEDEMIGWYHQLDGSEFEQALGVGVEQGSLACYSPWVTESDMTEQTELNWADLKNQA